MAIKHMAGNAEAIYIEKVFSSIYKCAIETSVDIITIIKALDTLDAMFGNHKFHSIAEDDDG